MTFEEELKSLEGKNTIEDVSALKIGLYLQERAKTDPSIERNLKKENKSLLKCYAYVKKEVGKKVRSNPMVMMDDEPVYNMSVHYYDEDDIKDEVIIHAEPEMVSDETKPISNAEKPSPKPIIEKKAETKRKKNDPVDGQISLF